MEDPDRLLGRLRLGREEYCQRLLTMLILDADYPRWNTRSSPSVRGLEFLRALEALSFGLAALQGDITFVDELDLPRRHENEQGCAPDYAVITGQRLWMIELKTEAASHRPGQIPAYYELGAHHFPDCAIDLTYLTPQMPTANPIVPPGARFAHLTWDAVTPLIEDVWSEVDGPSEAMRDSLVRALASIGTPWPAWREERLADPVALAAEIAARTASDGRQRAMDYEAGSLEDLQHLRLEVRQRLSDNDGPVVLVQPWLWNAATSGGRALTRAGAELGYELRFSRARAGGPSGGGQEGGQE